MTGILDWALTLRFFIYITVVFATGMTCFGIYLDTKDGSSPLNMKISCIFMNMKNSDYIRFSSIISRFLLILISAIVPMKSLVVLCLALLLLDIMIYIKSVNILFIVEDFFYTVLIFNAIALKDLFIGYTQDVSIQVSAILMIIMLLILAVLLGAVVTIKAFSADLDSRRNTPEVETNNEKKRAPRKSRI